MGNATKQLVLLLFFSILVSKIWAQKQNRPLRQPGYDNKVIHFGFSLGITSYAFNVERYEGITQTDSIYSIQSVPSKGYSIGIISDLRLTKRINFRFIPSLTYVQRNLDFLIHIPSSGKTILETKAMESTFVDFPFTIKYKSDRFGNSRAYVLGGAKLSIDLASQRKVEDEDLFKLKSFDFYWELGIGGDFYFEFFKLSPEIKISFGQNDMIVKDNSVFTSGIKKLSSRSILVSLNFE